MNIRFVLLFACLALLAGCKKSEVVNPDPQRNGNLEIALFPQLPEELEVLPSTKAPTNAEKFIYNVDVMVFDPAGVLLYEGFADGSNLTSITIPAAHIVPGARIYAFTNLGNNTVGNANYYRNYLNPYLEESDLLRALYVLDALRALDPKLPGASGFPMSGVYNVTQANIDNPAANPITIPVKRVGAKLICDVTVDAAAPADFRIMMMRFVNLAGVDYVAPRDFDNDGEEDPFPLQPLYYMHTDWFAPTAGQNGKKASVTVYSCENRIGTGPSRVDKNAAGDKPAQGTYLEILAEVNGLRYIYKVYFGGPAVDNYDILANTEYKATVTIRGVNDIDTDVRVSRDGTDWYVTSGLVLHYDGIYNNGRDPGDVRVDNNSPLFTDPQRPAYASSKYVYSATVPPIPFKTNSSDGTDGHRNRWKNIAPATEGKFNMPLVSTTNTSTSPKFTTAMGWGADCMIVNETGVGSDITIGSMELDPAEDILFPEVFTVEVIFRANALNTTSGGNDLFSFFYEPLGPTYVTADVEIYMGGLGLMAGNDWNGMNFGTDDLINRRRRVVIQFDGQKLIAWYGNRIVYTEPKKLPGAIPWARGPLCSSGPNATTDAYNTRAPWATQLNLGTWARHYAAETLRGRIYAFRFYNRLLTKAELDRNFALDMERYGMPSVDTPGE